MDFGNLRPSMDKLISLLKRIEHNTETKEFSTSAGTGNIPAGFKSVSITNNHATDDVTITLSDASTYVLKVGETFTDVAKGKLPAYTIAGGSHKWHGIK